MWSLSQNQLLIDSLFFGVDIPKLYFRDISKNGYEHEVVDGQQRLNAIFGFLNDEFPIADDADNLDGELIKGMFFSQLSTDLQMRFLDISLDVVFLNAGYTEDDVEEIFLRLQNGTPLNAAEKRRAIAGSMKAVVYDLSEHELFKLSAFSNKRFAYEDVVAKVLHMMLAGSITDIRPASIRRTYESNKTITTQVPAVAKVEKTFRYISKAFKNNHSPQLKRFSIITLSYLVTEMLEEYDLREHADEFAKSYLDFELKRKLNEELPEEKRNSKLLAYTNAARSDSLQDMQYRHELLKSHIVGSIPSLILKDETRDFQSEQRIAIFWRDNGICQMCGVKCEENNFHADHIKPHKSGGKTQISNGQVLCPSCNLKKGGKSIQ